MRRTVYGVGINDSLSPICTTEGGKTTLKVCYRMWKGFLERCYSRGDKYPQYEGCSVHEDWHLYSNFEKWFDAHYIEGYVLDKDMKVLGNKVYGPHTCVFVPAWLNTFLNPHTGRRGKSPIGVYKRHKKFTASISEKGKAIHLGSYDTEEEAYLAWRDYKLDIIVRNKDFIKSLSPNVYENLVTSVGSLR